MNTSTSFSELSSVILQFSVPVLEMVPDGLAALPFESHEEGRQRKSRMPTANSVLTGRDGTFMRPFVDDLIGRGLILVGAWFQERMVVSGDSHFIIRFTLVTELDTNGKDMDVSKTYFREGSIPFCALRDLSTDFFWKIRGYRNPADFPSAKRLGKIWFWSINPGMPISSRFRKPENVLVLEEVCKDFITPLVVSPRVFLRRTQEGR